MNGRSVYGTAECAVYTQYVCSRTVEAPTIYRLFMSVLSTCINKMHKLFVFFTVVETFQKEKFYFDDV